MLNELAFIGRRQSLINFAAEPAVIAEDPFIDSCAYIDFRSPPGTATTTYSHTCYPAHINIVKVNNTLVYNYMPPENDISYIFGCLVGPSPRVTGVTGPVAVPTN